MLCYRCGSHVQDGAEKCWNCGTILSASQRRGPTTAELRARQRTGSRVFGVVFKIGDLIANRYRVKDIVGSGGAGVVYRAHDQEIDVDVAVKVINAKLVQTSDEQRLFSRQTKISRKLSHQNVVRIYDEGRDEKRPYFTMQFLEGLSLRKIIDLRKEKKQTFAVQEIEPIFNQLCQALDYAHKTTFHGNLKPDNVIVLPDLLKITDFALLRGLPRKPFLAIQKSRGSNFRYLAPEVRLEVPDLTKAVDLYCLGVVLCEMLTGVVYDDAKPEQLSVSATGLDSSVVSIVKRCVARAPKDRYAQAGELYEDLRSAMAKGNLKSARVPAPEADPGPATEEPTQRLDINRHGERPVDEAAEDAPAEAAGDAKPEPVEVQPKLDVPESSAPPEEKREPSETFAVIDDDMIESATPSSQTATAKGAEKEAPAPAKTNGVPKNGALHVDEGPAAEEEGLIDAPDLPAGVEAEAYAAAPEEEEETALHEEDEPTESVINLEEISNSAIELIADPRATNIYNRVDSEGAPAGEVSERNQPTVQPEPLPDSAIPAPAFSQVARGATEQGRLDQGASEAPVAPAMVVKGAPEPEEAEVPLSRKQTQGRPQNRPAVSPRAREPTEALPRTKAKQRPMTRPRMPAVNKTLPPQVSTVPSGVAPHSIVESSVPEPPPRPQTMPSMSAVQPVPPLTPPSNNRVVYVTVALSLLAVLVAMGIVVKVTTDSANQQIATANERLAAMEQEMGKLRSVAEKAAQNENAAMEDAKAAAVQEEEARKQEEDAKRAAEEAQRKKAEAEAQAKKAEEEARRREAEAKRAADESARAEASRKAEVARKAAEARRKAAEAEARREREERQRAERERKRREAQERARIEAERRAKAEREARRRAEERAARLERERAATDAERAEERRKKEEERRARAEEERRRKKEEEERRKREAEEQKLAAAAAAEPSCPKGMVMVKGGAFMIGAPRNDPERNFGDKNYTSVEVPSFCIDYYEYPNGRGRNPTARVTFRTAKARCKRRGKRLCTEEEWEKACKGPSGSRYPYGNQWDPGKCNTEDDEGNDREVSKSGTFRKCRSGYNVFDLSGNVAEWVDTKAGSRIVVKGGSADRPGYDGRCAARKKKKPGTVDEGLGFRCCADPK